MLCIYINCLLGNPDFLQINVSFVQIDGKMVKNQKT